MIGNDALHEHGANVNNAPAWLTPALLALVLCGCAGSPATPPQAPCADGSHFELLGEIRWPHGLAFGSDAVGGLSSIDRDPASGLYYLVSDDRSRPGAAPLYVARIDYDASGLHGFTLQERRWLELAAAQHRASEVRPDAEALRLLPGGDRLLWSSEGDFARGQGPELIEARRSGQWLRRWALPGHWRLPARPHRARQGPRSGLTLEAMGLSTNGQTLWLAMESALKQDGAPPGAGRAGAPVRIAAYDIATRRPLREIAYEPDALPAGLWLLPSRALGGVSDILADGSDHLLVLERQYAPQHGFGARIYRMDTQDPSNTLDMETLVPGQFRAARKTLLLDLAQLGLRSVDNLEGMSWGAPLADGRRVLLLVSDDNFNPAQVTQLIALATCAP
jgi:hypothetical protein